MGEKTEVLTRKDSHGCEPYDSIQWAFEVHVKEPDTGIYNFAIQYGYGDTPDRIEFWVSENPNYDEEPSMVWTPAAEEN